MRKYNKALVNLAVAAVIFLAVAFLLPKVFVFFSPFVAGWIIALIAGPPVRFFEEKIKLKRKIGSAFVIIAVIAGVVLLIYFIGTQLVSQMMGLMGSLPEMWAAMEADLEEIAARLLDETGRRMEALGLTLRVEEGVTARLAREGFDPASGARPLRRRVQRLVEERVAEELLAGRLRRGDGVKVGLRENELAIEREKE